VTLEVVPVGDKASQEQFLRLPWQLYANDPAWVPELLLFQRDRINRKKNPFFDHGEAELFLARRDGKPVGRISAQIDHRHNQYHEESTGFFGFFEAVEDAEVAHALLTTAEAWLRQRGMHASRGPLSFAMDELPGVLVEGFETPPMVEMTHALPYYGPLIEKEGYAKVMDLLAYRWQITDPPARILEAVEHTRAVPGVRLRRINRLRLASEVDLLLDIYAQSWSDLWGFTPVSRRAARKIASDLLLIADPRVALIAEVDGEPAGMVVGVPNLNEATRDFNGFIDPVKAVKLLWRLKLRGTQTGRILLFGVKPKFRTRQLYGLPFLLLYELYRGARKGRYKWCEESWVLENNTRLNALMPHWHAHVYKRYRIYEKALQP
jgi:hypothetical protein